MVVCACVCVCYRGRASSERVGLRDEDVEREREFFLKTRGKGNLVRLRECSQIFSERKRQKTVFILLL